MYTVDKETQDQKQGQDTGDGKEVGSRAGDIADPSVRWPIIGVRVIRPQAQC